MTDYTYTKKDVFLCKFRQMKHNLGYCIKDMVDVKSFFVGVVKMIFIFIFFIGNFQWLMFEDGAPGFKIFGVPCQYYKWEDTVLIFPEDKWRVAEKRELYIKVDKGSF